MRTLLFLCLLAITLVAAQRRQQQRRPTQQARRPTQPPRRPTQPARRPVQQPRVRQDTAPSLLGGDTGSSTGTAAASSGGGNTRSVVVTSYTSATGQTDSSPFLAAWNNRLACVGSQCGMLINGRIQRIIAVSRSLERAGLGNRRFVTISGLGGGLDGQWMVADKMSSRFTYDKIDLYFGRDLRAARQFGVRRNVRISW